MNKKKENNFTFILFVHFYSFLIIFLFSNITSASILILIVVKNDLPKMTGGILLSSFIPSLKYKNLLKR